MIKKHYFGSSSVRVPACVYVYARASINYYKRPSEVLDFVVAFHAMPSSLCSFVCTEIDIFGDVSVVESQADVCPGR